LLDGLLGNDLLGFHVRYHCQNFMDTVDRTLEARIDYEQAEIVRRNKPTLVRPFPISIDFERQEAMAAGPEVDQEIQRCRSELSSRSQYLGIGIERIDYTKGIPERLRALDRFFEKYAEYRGRLTFFQVGVPSRSHVPQYQVVDAEIDHLVEKINWRWSTPGWRPLIYAKRHFSPVEMMALHRLADFCVVSSLHDGMNLVAKEFVASRFDEDGVLLLSQFTGSSLELTDALLFNPFAVDEMADAIHQAVTMAPEERRRRMQRMRAAVRDNNVYRWAGKILSALLKVDTAEPPAPTPTASPGPRRARRRAGRAAGPSPAAARRNGAAPK
jgi:trehalose 6-phosphate synthase